MRVVILNTYCDLRVILLLKYVYVSSTLFYNKDFFFLELSEVLIKFCILIKIYKIFKIVIDLNFPNIFLNMLKIS